MTPSLKPQVLIIASFFLLLVSCAMLAGFGVPEARSAILWIAGAFCSELAHLARKSAE